LYDYLKNFCCAVAKLAGKKKLFSTMFYIIA